MTRYESMVLSLLGRMAFPANGLREAVTKSKRSPEAYVRGYNACDGRHTVSQIAAIIGVTVGTVVPILQQWESMGIVFELETQEKGKYYRHIYPLKV